MENRDPIGDLFADWVGGLMVGLGAALAVLLWALAGVEYLRWLTNECTSGSCVAQPTSQRTVDMGPAYLLVWSLAVALLATYGSALGTIVRARRHRDWLAVGALLVIFALSLVAHYALWRQPEDTFVNALYGFSPDGFAFHPFAYGASFALMIFPAPAALAYNLLHERAHQASSLVSLAGLAAAVVLVVAIRLTPAVQLPH